MAKELEFAKHAKDAKFKNKPYVFFAPQGLLSLCSGTCFADSSFDFTFLKTGHGYHFDEYPVSHK